MEKICIKIIDVIDRWIRDCINEFKHWIKFNRCGTPRQTLAIVSINAKSFWSLNSNNNEKKIFLHVYFCITNLIEKEIRITSIKSNIKKRRVEPSYPIYAVKKHNSDYYGLNYPIPAGKSTEMTVTILYRYEGEKDNIKIKIAILDQFSNKHWIPVEIGKNKRTNDTLHL